jgi:DHA1 family multidrug resistance protein-like MFS transporter
MEHGRKVVNALRQARSVRNVISLDRNLLILGATVVVSSTFWNSWYPFLPIYLSKMGAGAKDLGLLFSILFFASSLAHFAGGMLADRFGRKFPIVSGGALSSLSLFATASVSDWKLLSIFIFFGTCFSFLQMTPPQLIIAESTSESERAKAFGNWAVYSKIGPLIGPILGGILAPEYDLRYLLFLNAIAVASMTVIRATCLRETFDRKANGAKRERPKTRFTLSGNLLLFLYSCIVLSFAGGLTWAFVPIFSTDFIHMSTAQIGMMFSITSLMMLISSMPSGKIIEAFGPKRTLIISYFLSCAINIPWMYSPNSIIAISLNAISNACLGIGEVAYQTAIVKMTSLETRGRVMGGFDAIFVVTYSVGSAVGGWVWENASPYALFWVAGLLGMPVAFVMSLVRIENDEIQEK